MLTPGHTSNYADRKRSWIYFSGTLDAAIWGCEPAKGEGRVRIDLVESTDGTQGTPAHALPFANREPIRLLP